MSDLEKMLEDPHFQRLLARRSRLRWGFSGVLIGAYLARGILGVYFADAYAAPFLGNTLPTGLALGFMIFSEPFLGLPIFEIGLAIYYVAAILTIVSMIIYLRAAWPVIKGNSL